VQSIFCTRSHVVFDTSVALSTYEYSDPQKLNQVPYALIFAGADCKWDVSSIANFAFDIFFLVDIVVNFNTAYMDDTGTIIRDHDSIAKQYLKSVLPHSISLFSSLLSPLHLNGRRAGCILLLEVWNI
jgi:hypothetical protein